MGKVTALQPTTRSSALVVMRESIRVAMAVAINEGASLKDIEDELLDVFTRTRKLGNGG